MVNGGSLIRQSSGQVIHSLPLFSHMKKTQALTMVRTPNFFVLCTMYPYTCSGASHPAWYRFAKMGEYSGGISYEFSKREREVCTIQHLDNIVSIHFLKCFEFHDGVQRVKPS